MSSSFEEIQKELENSSDKAYGFYQHHQFEEALPLYRRAYDAAVLTEDREKIVKYKQWEGHCLYHLGRFREALAVLISLSQLSYSIPHEYLSGIVDQIDIAMKLPIGLSKIKMLIDEAYKTIRENGLNSSTSIILIEEAFLAYLQYNYEFALDKSLEALACHDSEAKVKCDILIYYRSIMDTLLQLNRIQELKEYLHEIQDLNVERIISKQIMIYGFKSEIAMNDGYFIEAYKFALQRLECERKIDSEGFVSLRLIVRAGIAANKLDEIRIYLAEMLAMRHSECGNRRYQINLICGDYNMAMFRIKSEECYYKIAEKFYYRANKIGNNIDKLFNCDGRRLEIANRLNEHKRSINNKNS